MRKHLSKFAVVLHRDTRREMIKPASQRFIKMMMAMPRRKALYKLQVEVLKTLKKVWRTVNTKISEAGEKLTTRVLTDG
jgi:SUMO ligase MMS21 Smc5/6 complex component